MLVGERAPAAEEKTTEERAANTALTLAHQAQYRYRDGRTGALTMAASRREADAKVHAQKQYPDAILIELTCGHPELACYAAATYKTSDGKERTTVADLVVILSDDERIVVEIYSDGGEEEEEDDGAGAHEALRDAKYTALFNTLAKDSNQFQVWVMGKPTRGADVSMLTLKACKNPFRLSSFFLSSSSAGSGFFFFL